MPKRDRQEKPPQSVAATPSTTAEGLLPKVVEQPLPAINCLDDLAKLKYPFQAQQLVDSFKYNTDDLVRCPAEAIKARKAHCFDGALLAAAALRRMNVVPFIVFLDAHNDDGHLLVVYTKGVCLGAIAKSNFVGLRYREPVYKTLRELVMSYFDEYCSMEGLRSLRSYSALIPLTRFDKHNWETDNGAVNKIGDAIQTAKEYFLLAPAQIKALRPVDVRRYRSGMLGTDLAGCYGAKEKEQNNAKKKRRK